MKTILEEEHSSQHHNSEFLPKNDHFRTTSRISRQSTWNTETTETTEVANNTSSRNRKRSENMFFGKKKAKKEEIDEESPEQYDVNAEESDDDIPPPPPGTQSNSQLFDDEGSEGKGSPAVEAEDVGVSFLTDPSDDDDAANRNPHRRKKMLLVFGALASLAILLGLTIKYARNGTSSSSQSVAGLESSETFFETGNETVAIESKEEEEEYEEEVEYEEEEVEEEKDEYEEEMTDAPKDEYETMAPTDKATEEGTYTGTTYGTMEATEEGTVGATSGATVGATYADTYADTDAATEEGTDAGTEAEKFNDCTTDELYVSSKCDAGMTSATITMCASKDDESMFWEWIETPALYQSTAYNDWGWLTQGRSDTIERFGIPPGTYEIGLFSNGDESLSEYPLITSTSFTIICG